MTRGSPPWPGQMGSSQPSQRLTQIRTPHVGSSITTKRCENDGMCCKRGTAGGVPERPPSGARLPRQGRGPPWDPSRNARRNPTGWEVLPGPERSGALPKVTKGQNCNTRQVSRVWGSRALGSFLGECANPTTAQDGHRDHPDAKGRATDSESEAGSEDVTPRPWEGKAPPPFSS